MFKKIYREIKKHKKIVIARHVGVDPDAFASQVALRDAIKLTFKDKIVNAVGTGSSRFSYIGKLDKTLDDTEGALLIVLDTPDKKRIDGIELDQYKTIVKLDHHPFIEKFGQLEYIDEKASSTAEIVMDFIYSTKMECNSQIAQTLYIGLISDSNRFLFDSSDDKTFGLVSYFLGKYKFNTIEVFEKLYMRPLSEVRFQGFISQNMKVSDNGVASIIITDDILNKYKVDSAAAGNMINEFNYINEVLIWVTVTEDIKNENIRISIRSRGPEINKVAEKYNGGGHKFAAGVKTSTLEEAQFVINDLDAVSKKYIEEMENNKED